MAETAMQSWVGRSDEIGVPLLGAEFWKEGTEICGELEGKREQKIGGSAYRLTLDAPLSLDGEEVTVVELPSLTGIKNALEALRLKAYTLKKGDVWKVACVGIRKSKKADFSDSPEFQIDVIRR